MIMTFGFTFVPVSVTYERKTMRYNDNFEQTQSKAGPVIFYLFVFFWFYFDLIKLVGGWLVFCVFLCISVLFLLLSICKFSFVFILFIIYLTFVVRVGALISR